MFFRDLRKVLVVAASLRRREGMVLQKILTGVWGFRVLGFGFRA